MNHFTAPSFWACYAELTPEQRELADKSYELLKADPLYPSLHFKKVGRFWSARVTQSIRVEAVEIPKGQLGFWTGQHDECMRIISGQSAF